MAVTYELYVQQRGRWILEAQFAGHLRQVAIEEAKDLQRQGHVQASKVVREQTDEDGFIRESTIYNSERKKTGRLSAQQREAARGTLSEASRGYADIEVTVREGPVNYADMEINVGGDVDYDGSYKHTRGINRRAAASVVNIMSPEALVLTKFFLILAGSFAFAAFMTWLFLRTGLVAN